MRHTPPEAVTELTSLAMLAPFVIATRLTDLWMHSGSPTARSRREADLMVTEKIQAVVESAVAMNIASARVGLEIGLGLLASRTPNVMGNFDRIMTAGLRRYTRTVRANQRRLMRPASD